MVRVKFCDLQQLDIVAMFESNSFYIVTDLLQHLYLKFSIYQNANQDDMLSLECQGNLILEDARTLDRVSYPISVSMEEKMDWRSQPSLVRLQAAMTASW